MTTSEQRFEHLRFDTSAAAARRSPAEAGAWYRLVLVLAAFGALAAWGLANPGDRQRSVGDQFGPSTIASGRQLYDGRGKWSGYMAR